MDRGFAVNLEERGKSDMRHRGVILALLLTVASPALAFAQAYVIQGVERYLRVEWEAGQSRRGPVVAGYVYNTSGYSADRVRLSIDSVDAAGQVTASELVQVLGTVPGGNRSYFEFPAHNPGPYRVRVISFDPIGRGQ